MYRYFETLVNPYAERNLGTLPRQIWPFIRSELEPFRHLIQLLLLTSLGVAVMETWLISYSGRVIDYINTSDKSLLWSDYGVELIFVALFILFARPVAHFFTAMLQHQTLSGSLRDQVRWRAYTHMLGQSRGVFHDDFAGRLINRVMQVGPAVEDNVFTFFEAAWFVAIYFLAALWIMTGISGVLAILMVICLSLYYWSQDLVSIGEISIVAALVMRLSAMTGWIMWVSTLFFENAGKIHESMESLAPATNGDGCAECTAFACRSG